MKCRIGFEADSYFTARPTFILGAILTMSSDSSMALDARNGHPSGLDLSADSSFSLMPTGETLSMTAGLEPGRLCLARDYDRGGW
jgi:hypothetical protein